MLCDILGIVNSKIRFRISIFSQIMCHSLRETHLILPVRPVKREVSRAPRRLGANHRTQIPKTGGRDGFFLTSDMHTRKIDFRPGLPPYPAEGAYDAP